MDSAEKLKRAADVIHNERAEGRDSVRQALMRARTGQGPAPSLSIEEAAVSSELGDVYYFLVGLCLRNLLKGLIAHAHPEYVRPSGELDNALKGTGTLDDLMMEAGVYSDLALDEKTFLHMAETAFGFFGDARISLSELECDIQSQFAWECSHTNVFGALYRKWPEKLIRTYVCEAIGAVDGPFPEGRGKFQDARIEPEQNVVAIFNTEEPFGTSPTQ